MSALPLLGSCAGHRIRSAIPFRTLRDGDCGTVLRVERGENVEPRGELIAEWHPRQGNPFHGRLLKTDAGFAFWASDAGWFAVNPREPSITIGSSEDELTLTAEVRMFGVPSSLITLERGDLSMHAAAVEVAGGAVVLAGPSRYGKTTLAAAFAAAGHRVLAEDMATCTLRDGASVYPGPAVMRLRPDVAGGFDLPDRRIVTERERVFVPLDGPLRGTGAPVPLAALLFLREGDGDLQLTRARTADAIRDLWTLTFSLPTDGSRAATFERAADLIAQVPVFDLRRALRLDTLQPIVTLVEELVGSAAARLPS